MACPDCAAIERGMRDALTAARRCRFLVRETLDAERRLGARIIRRRWRLRLISG
jgi:hypothetical protein